MSPRDPAHMCSGKRAKAEIPLNLRIGRARSGPDLRGDTPLSGASRL